MSYPKQEVRIELNDGKQPETVLELSYVMAKLVDEYLQRGGVSGVHIKEVLGVLEATKLETYRRVFAGYEDTKIRQNGETFKTATDIVEI